MNRQNLMDAANSEWRKCRSEPETTIRNQISQYFVTCPPIIRNANFFLPPSLYNSNSSSSNSTVSPNYRANSLSSHLSSRLSNEESDLASNASAQCQALNLIKEAEAKANEYE
ncbi:11093_t:CDS:1, partial [Gigaspora rosea]